MKEQVEGRALGCLQIGRGHWGSNPEPSSWESNTLTVVLPATTSLYSITLGSLSSPPPLVQDHHHQGDGGHLSGQALGAEQPQQARHHRALQHALQPRYVSRTHLRHRYTNKDPANICRFPSGSQEAACVEKRRGDLEEIYDGLLTLIMITPPPPSKNIKDQTLGFEGSRPTQGR